jgi:hypothetical protein
MAQAKVRLISIGYSNAFDAFDDDMVGLYPSTNLPRSRPLCLRGRDVVRQENLPTVSTFSSSILMSKSSG